MALLGAQLVITLIIVSLIQKLGHHFSFGRWLLCSTGLIRYLYPTDDTLRELAHVPKEKSTKRNKIYENGKQKTFHVPKNLEFELETAKISVLDVIHLKYYTEYQWLLDFSVYAAIVYSLTEIYKSFYSIENEINLSVIWCMLIVGYALYPFVFGIFIELSEFYFYQQISIQLYFRSDESMGERSACIVMGFIYLLIAMVFLIVNENILEFGLEEAYSSFNKSASVFINTQNLKSTGPASKIVLKFFISVWCAILGTIFTFPGLRTGRMHCDLLKSLHNTKLIYAVVNLSFAMPLILIVLWIKPIARDNLTIRTFGGRPEPLMSAEMFESLRIILIVVTFIVKICLTPKYLQAYLNMADRRIKELRKEAGRITNIDLQKKIAAVFYYLCVATVQYIAPIIVCLYLALMFKTLGKFNWFNWTETLNECPLDSSGESSNQEEINTADENINLALENLKSVFTQDVFRGLFGFATWWSCFAYFASTSLGFLYHMYFTGY